MKQQLSPEQMDAVQRFAAQMGRTWKSELRDAWMTGNYPAGCMSNTLQQIRNAFGPSWLVRFSLKKCGAAYVPVEHVPGEPPTLCDRPQGHDGECA